MVNILKEEVNKFSIDDISLKDSILGQVNNLSRESANRAIKRLLRESNLEKEEIQFIEEAYSSRSKIVHEGRRIPELDHMNARLDQILQRLYSIKQNIAS